jgi:diacylglycerol kinase (ATP)
MIPGSDKDHPTLGKSFLFAIQGLFWAVKHERNIKIMLAGALFAVVMAAVLRVDAAGWGVILVGCGMVLCAELLNTAVETVVDLVSPEYHQLAGRAKDIAAAGVWILCVFVAVAGIVVYVRAGLALLGM